MNQIEFTGIVEKGVWEMSPPQIKLRRQWLSGQKDGTVVRETLSKETKPKTHQQVKAHFGLVVMMIRERLIELGWGIFGVAPSQDMIHEILKKACGGVGDNGETKRLSEMSTAEAGRFFENCCHWAATELQLYIPLPDKNWKESGDKKG